MGDAPYGEMQRVVREREVALSQQPIKPALGPSGARKYDLSHARKINEALGKGLAHDAGKVVEARRQRIEIEAKKVYRALNADKSIYLTVDRSVSARQLAMHWDRIHKLGAFRVLGFETQRIQMQQFLRSRGLELEMTNRQREELKRNLDKGLDITRVLYRSLSTTPELVKAKGQRIELVMARGYSLGRSAAQAQRTEIVKAVEIAKVRAVVAQKAPAISLVKSQEHLERREERAVAKAAEKARLRFEQTRALVEGRRLGPVRELSPEVKKAQELHRAMQPDLSVGERLAIERANAKTKEALEMVRKVAPEVAEAMERKLAQSMTPLPGPVLKKPNIGRKLAP